MKPIFAGVLKFTGACSLLFTLSFLVGTNVFSAEPTLLRLKFEDGQGQSVKVSQATLIMVVGNYVDRLPLETTAEGLVVPLDPSWLNANWPGGKSRLRNMDRAFVYLKAKGYAPVCSSPIQWMGTEMGGAGKNMTVSFPRSKVLVVSKERSNTLTVDFRKPTARFVRLSSDEGAPIPGAKVKTYVYWSRTEAGELSGADFLGNGTSDETGRVPVVDGDFTYAIEITYKATPDNAAKTVLVVKRFEDREYPLTLPSKPLADSAKK